MNSWQRRFLGERQELSHPSLPTIYRANGLDDPYQFDIEDLPPCGVHLGGMLLWMEPDSASEGLENSRLTLDGVEIN
jgi:hypothetical protein